MWRWEQAKRCATVLVERPSWFLEEDSRGDGVRPKHRSGLTRPCEYDALRSLIPWRTLVRFSPLALVLLLPLSVSTCAQSAASKPEVVPFHATIDNVKYVFGVAAPVAHLKPSNILEANSLDCFGNAIKKPGDTLVVHILDLQVDGNQGLGAFAPGFGALNQTNYTPMLHAPLPEKIWFYPIDHASNTAAFQALDSNYKVKIPLHPFLGCIGVAPAGGETRSSIVPAEFGGNMDAPEASA